jgi:hypothetical protein
LLCTFRGSEIRDNRDGLAVRGTNESLELVAFLLELPELFDSTLHFAQSCASQLDDVDGLVLASVSGNHFALLRLWRRQPKASHVRQCRVVLLLVASISRRETYARL